MLACFLVLHQFCNVPLWFLRKLFICFGPFPTDFFRKRDRSQPSPLHGKLHRGDGYLTKNSLSLFFLARGNWDTGYMYIYHTCTTTCNRCMFIIPVYIFPSLIIYPQQLLTDLSIGAKKIIQFLVQVCVILQHDIIDWSTASTMMQAYWLWRVIFNHLSHAIENTANQNAGKLLHIFFSIPPNLPIGQCNGVFSMAWFKMVMQPFLISYKLIKIYGATHKSIILSDTTQQNI